MCTLSAYGTSCTFSCLPGFALVGDATITCGDGTGTDGQWSAADPTCEGMLCVLKIVLFRQLLY